MTIEIVIIPVSKSFEDSAYDIRSKLTNSVKIPIRTDIDNNYDIPLNKRISKWRKNDYDIVIIDKDFTDSETIVVRFGGKGTKAKKMDVSVFIELVSSYDSESDSDSGTQSGSESGTQSDSESDTEIRLNKKKNSNKKTGETDDNDESFGCVIM